MSVTVAHGHDERRYRTALEAALAVSLFDDYRAVAEPGPEPSPPEPTPPASAPSSASAFGTWNVAPRATGTPFDPVRDYPPAARATGVEGTVWLRVAVDPAGRVAAVEVVRSGAAPLEEAAKGIVRRWRFAPAEQAGTPVAATVVVTVRFALAR